MIVKNIMTRIMVIIITNSNKANRKNNYDNHNNDRDSNASTDLG